MSKERLEEIKDRVIIDKVYYKFIESKGRWGKVYTLSDEDYRYLMQQAERVQELEEENVILKATRAGNEEHIEVLHKQNKRYREALEFYADEDNYRVTWDDDYEPILHDDGSIARQALEGGE